MDIKKFSEGNFSICVIGLGYVGLPLAFEFSKKYKTVGFDLSASRIKALKMGNDSNLMIDAESLRKSKLRLTDKPKLKNHDIYIITVPTPIDDFNIPDLTPLKEASKLVSASIKKGAIVIYESTVFPGATEEICVPILEESGLVFNKDFFCGYSPERINPGDTERTLTKIKKVVSGSNKSTLKVISSLYSSIIEAGIYQAASIKVAEAAKVIENTQRDLNIAFTNELAKIFDLMNIDTHLVLEAASTKWNFIKFEPGLVGGHCIGVDPYYLTYKAQSLGYHPEIILAGRKINDTMHKFVRDKIVRELIKRDLDLKKLNVLCLGLTFKENCNDIRNSKILNLVNEMLSLGFNVSYSDPYVSEKIKFNSKCKKIEYKNLFNKLEDKFDLIILASPHHEFLRDIKEIKQLLRNKNSLFFDIKNKVYTKNINEKI